MLIDADKVIAYLEERKAKHASTAWYEFAVWKELDDVRRFVEKMQEEESIKEIEKLERKYRYGHENLS